MQLSPHAQTSPMPLLQPIAQAEFLEQAWANGNGRTTELAAGPDRESWQWRISMARIDADGDFSVLPGVRRQLAPLDGGIELHFDDGQTLAARRLQVIDFNGSDKASCRLVDGPGRDINLMLREGVAGQLIVRPLVGAMLLPQSASTRWFVLVLAGQIELRAGEERLQLGHGQAAWLYPGTAANAHLDGGGEIALVRLQQPDQRI